MLGYCTNVHPGTSLESIRHNLVEHTTAVKALVRQEQPNAFAGPMPVGLWFAAEAAGQLVNNPADLVQFRQTLETHGLATYTLNGFPYADFHQPVVKHAVYLPTWAEHDRLAYTKNLATLLAALLDEPQHEGTLSTLPIAWPPATAEHRMDLLAAAAQNLAELTEHLSALEAQTGKRIRVAIEPEPGCLFDRAEHIAAFFTDELSPRIPSERLARHLGVCHDVCHSAVMFEPQSHALTTYRQAGVPVVKVQLSSAIAVDFDRMDTETRTQARAQLKRFAEDRYLHQTCVRLNDGRTSFFEDLPQALIAHEHMNAADAIGEWRVHFHVPLSSASLGLLHTTQNEVTGFLQALRPEDHVKHFETETYAWTVLPEDLQPASLAHGIAQELVWAQQQMSACGL